VKQGFLSRLAIAALFVAATTVELYTEGDLSLPGGYWGLLLAVGQYLALGLLVGRWWALLVAFIPVLAATGVQDPGGQDLVPWGGVLLGTIYLLFWFTLLGVVVRKLADRWCDRSHPRSSRARRRLARDSGDGTPAGWLSRNR
jgi:hypothetical protein